MFVVVLWNRSSRMSALLLESFTGPLALPGRYFSDIWYPRSRTQSSPWPRSGRVHVLASSSSRCETCTVTIGHRHGVESDAEADQRNGLTKRATRSLSFDINCSRDNNVSFDRVPVGRNRLTDMENTWVENGDQPSFRLQDVSWHSFFSSNYPYRWYDRKRQ